MIIFLIIKKGEKTKEGSKVLEVIGSCGSIHFEGGCEFIMIVLVRLRI